MHRHHIAAQAEHHPRHRASARLICGLRASIKALGTLAGVLLFASLALGPALVPARAEAAKRIFKVSDQTRDDHGDGSLIYPETADLEPGDLDIVSFSARRATGGTELEIVLARKIKKPIRQALDAGGTQLTDLARHDFFTFNVDVYIDTDRVPGSGRVIMLPGRNAEIDPSSAWEKAVCLTPRPEIARSQLQRIMLWQARKEYKSERGSLRRDQADEMSNQIALDVTDHTYFPNRIRVIGPKIRFFVPDSFLGGPAQPDWSYVVAISGADITATMPVDAIDVGVVQLDFAGLMILPVEAGGSRHNFGSEQPDTEMLPNLVDILVPEGVSQEELLASYRTQVTGKVKLLGVVPGS